MHCKTILGYISPLEKRLIIHSMKYIQEYTIQNNGKKKQKKLELTQMSKSTKKGEKVI